MKVVGILSIALLIFSCGEKRESENQKAEEPSKVNHGSVSCGALKNAALRLDSVLLTQMSVDDSSARIAIKAFTDFSYYCQNDTLSPIFMVKTAQVARAINNLEHAKMALEQCIAIHTDWRDRAIPMMMLANLYESPSYMHDREKARELYSNVIEEFPGTSYAESSKGAIQMLGKTDQEILQILKKKNGQK